MCDDCHIFLIATLVFTRLLLIEIFPPYRITIWLIDNVKFLLVCLLDDLILGFHYRNLHTGNRWTRTRLSYHPCITSEPTNQVCYTETCKKRFSLVILRILGKLKCTTQLVSISFTHFTNHSLFDCLKLNIIFSKTTTVKAVPYTPIKGL